MRTIAYVSKCISSRYEAQRKVPFSIKPVFVPNSKELTNSMVVSLSEYINKSRRLVTITGAGISTESGIPDYRSEGVGLYARKNYRPLQYQEFLKYPNIRQRYWARSFAGWPSYSKIQPCQNHSVVGRWETEGKLHWLITQNVDSLHVKAGSRSITELHGALRSVACLSCGSGVTRDEYQQMIAELNPLWSAHNFEIATDGDVFLTDDQVKGFQVPPCESCGGPMKPNIVFFGDNVPRHTVELLHSKVKDCDAVLVLGSSLQVYSAYRFVHAAYEQKKPIAIVNIGPTRADNICSLKIDVKCGDILPRVEI